MGLTLFSVGKKYPDERVESINIISNQALESDITLFTPKIDLDPTTKSGSKYYFNSEISETIKRMTEHWKKEIMLALDQGKTIIIFLEDPKKYNLGLDTVWTTYDMLPFDPTPLEQKQGEEMKLKSEASFLNKFFQDFEDYIKYFVRFQCENCKELLVTKTGEIPVGVMYESKNGGHALLLPPVKLFSEFNEWNRNARTNVWTEKGKLKVKQFINHIIQIHKSLKKSSEATPQPEWVESPKFQSKKEKKIRSQINQLKEKLQDLEEKRRKLEEEILELEEFKKLLYENGKSLEKSVIQALKILGFEAEEIKEGDLQIDNHFVSEEGRFIGEVSGKDTNQIHIDKLSQLIRNQQDDFARDGVDNFAKCVLFGNAFRKSPIKDRNPDYFTQKCIKSAKNSNVALVRTPDLYKAVIKVIQTGNQELKKSCREAILNSEGEIVEFPE